MKKVINIIFMMMFCLAVDTWADADTAAASIPPPALSVNYTGPALSAVIPGAGQVYQGRYFLGGFFLAAEAITGTMTIYWFDEAKMRLDDFKYMRNHATALRLIGKPNADSLAGLQSVFADQMEFEARRARYMSYTMLSWTVGIHLFNFTNALEFGGVSPRWKSKSPVTAGVLAAVPFFGLGQLYNVRPNKAGMIAMTQTSLAVMASTEHHLMNFANDKYNQMRDSTSMEYEYRGDHLSYWKSRYDQAFSRRNTYLWVTLFAYIYGLLDAVVDAHLSDYPERIKAGSDLTFGIGVIGQGSEAGILLSVDF